MANENDVVRLKHLQPLVSGVANDFSIQNGDNAVRLKHLVSLATALDNDKQAPVLSLGSWSSADTVYSAPITYTGDGTLSTDIGTITNDILTVEDADGNFNGIISASSGYDYAATKINFNYMTDTVTVTVEAAPTTVTVEAEPVTVTVEAEPTTVTVEAEPVTVTVQAEPTTVTVQAEPKTNPTFSLGEWAGSNNTYSAVVSYNGDGVLTANTGTLSGSTITVSDEDGNFNGVISAAEGTNFAPANLTFTHTKETVGGGSGKPVPELYVEGFSAGGLYSLNEIHPITYTGDSTYFEVYARKENSEDVKQLGVTVTGNASTGYKMHVTAPAGFYGEQYILCAYETSNYAAAYCQFMVDTGD